MSDSHPRVFISYAREDQDDAVRIYDALRSLGCRPWMDIRDLLGGQQWKYEVAMAVRACDYFVALFSSRSLARRGYFHKELSEALEVWDETPYSDIYLIPIRLNDCKPTERPDDAAASLSAQLATHQTHVRRALLRAIELLQD